MDKDLILLGIASVIGALTGLWLSFTALSHLIIGGVIAAIPVMLLSAYYICDSIRKGKFSKKDLFESYLCMLHKCHDWSWSCCNRNCFFPGAMIGIGYATLAGGAIAPIIAIFPMYSIIVPIAEKVNEYIIFPIIEYFSLKGKEHEQV
ncbi:Predicted protein [Wolbachia endosymbiont strain TRS of Brugia malayi]|uniref:hypothetical protein n=1 Tax=Wolbachia endosymbiont of Brugia malayi TaxID=80849 RepID=UPI00004C946E|nr:hypothetical protein [Wolbachia endosymbiont of Brugia malayi]AAW71198.1 Predicted protein [Wolbachia endosymbiont strain TRS of Brugia malayi]